MCNEREDKGRWFDEWYEKFGTPFYNGGNTVRGSNSYADRIGSYLDWYERILNDIARNADKKETKVKFLGFGELDDVDFEYDESPFYSDFVLDSDDVYQELQDILVKKQKDYGPNNIRNAPGGPLNGLSVRLYDKMSRLKNLVESGATPENESLRDTFIDIANYGVIGLMILDDTFPKAKD